MHFADFRTNLSCTPAAFLLLLAGCGSGIHPDAAGTDALGGDSAAIADRVDSRVEPDVGRDAATGADSQADADSGTDADSSVGPSDADFDGNVADAEFDGSAADTGADAADVVDAAFSTIPWLAYSSQRGTQYDLFLTRLDGSERRRLTSTPETELYPGWSPDGQHLAFARTDAIGLYQLAVFDLAHDTIASLPTGVQNATLPAYSPDGMWIAFEGRIAGASTTEIFRVPAAGGVATALTTDPGRDTAPAWSPDGSVIYFVSNRSGTFEIYAMSPTGAGQRAVTTGRNILGRPAVSPDGLTLAFSRTPVGTQSVVEVWDLATSAERMIAPNGAQPTYTPDGLQLAITTSRLGNPDLSLIDSADGAHPFSLTDDTAIDTAPAIGPVPVRP